MQARLAEFKSFLLTYKSLALPKQASMPVDVAVVPQPTEEESQMKVETESMPELPKKMDLKDLVAQVEIEMNPNPVLKNARVCQQ